MTKTKSAVSNQSKSSSRVRPANRPPKLAKKSPTSTSPRSGKSAIGDQEVTIDRRAGGGRRQQDSPSVLTSAKKSRKNRSSKKERSEANASTANRPVLERREKVSRRRQIDPTTCERDYTGAEIEFMNALDDYKRKSGRMFPTCSEVLEVIRMLGYVQLTPAELIARNTPETDSESDNPTNSPIQADLGYETEDSDALATAILPGE